MVCAEMPILSICAHPEELCAVLQHQQNKRIDTLTRAFNRKQIAILDYHIARHLYNDGVY